MPDNFTTADQGRTTGYNTFEEIPQLEGEYWEQRQFVDADNNILDHHNAQTESKHIRKEYSEHLLNLSDNEYYFQEYQLSHIQYSVPDPEYDSPTWRSNKWSAPQ